MGSPAACKILSKKRDLGSYRNPELEKLRNEVLDPKYEDEHKTLAESLANDLKSIHAAYLFDTCGEIARAQICQVISSTPKCSSLASSASWKDLAHELGLNYHMIGCIENKNTCASDYTEIVLMWYAQKADATLDKVILALSKLRRFDAINLAWAHLKALEKCARRDQVARTEDDDSGYHSIDLFGSEEATHDGILRSYARKHLTHQLPITLRNFDETISHITISTKSEDKTEDNHQQASIINKVNTKNKRKWSKCVMLTFAKDGEQTAYKVAELFRQQEIPIGVIILEENIDLVQNNPEHYITQLISWVHYIIPIITPEYLRCIEQGQDLMEYTTSAFDTRYVKLIHTLMYNYYVSKSCFNDKIRSVIPEKFENIVIKDKRLKKYVILHAFVSESKIDKLIMMISKKKKR